MTRARELYREGRLGEAIGSLQTYLRDRPSDTAARVFLFELLCFSGDLVRAGRQLYALGTEGEYKSLVSLYGLALEAESARQEGASISSDAAAPAPPVAGTLNGKPFTMLSDMDDSLGPRLEFIAAGEFHRVPFSFLSRIEIAPPARLRDLYFLPASVVTGPELKSFSFEQVLIPCLYAGSFRYGDESIKLGRATEWFRREDGAVVPAGLRTWVYSAGADSPEEEIPIAEVRLVEFERPEPLNER